MHNAAQYSVAVIEKQIHGRRIPLRNPSLPALAQTREIMFPILPRTPGFNQPQAPRAIFNFCAQKPPPYRGVQIAVSRRLIQNDPRVIGSAVGNGNPDGLVIAAMYYYGVVIQNARKDGGAYIHALAQNNHRPQILYCDFPESLAVFPAYQKPALFR